MAMWMQGVNNATSEDGEFWSYQVILISLISSC